MKDINNYILEKLFIGKEYKGNDLYKDMCELCHVTPADSYKQKVIKKWIDDNEVESVYYLSDFDIEDVNRTGITMVDPKLKNMINKDKDKVQKMYAELASTKDYQFSMFGKDISICYGPDVFFIIYESSSVKKYPVPWYILAVIKNK